MNLRNLKYFGNEKNHTNRTVVGFAKSAGYDQFGEEEDKLQWKVIELDTMDICDRFWMESRSKFL